MEKINTTIEKAKKEVSDLIVQAQHNQMKAQPGATQQESFEREVNRVLNKARDDAGLSATGSLRETGGFHIHSSWFIQRCLGESDESVCDSDSTIAMDSGTTIARVIRTERP